MAVNGHFISLTFDDGWQSQFDAGLPVLDEYGVKATFYIITKFLSGGGQRHMDAKAVLELHRRGHEIGAHTVTHPDLTYSFLWKGREILQSKLDLIQYGIEAHSFAYPYGRHHTVIRRMARRAGYINARAVEDDFNRGRCNPWRIKGKFVMRDTSLAAISRWITESIEKRYWLVLIFHQMEDMVEAPFGCGAGVVGEICEEIRRRDMEVLPLTEGFTRFAGRC